MKRYKNMLVALILIATSLLVSQCVLPERVTDDYYVRIMEPLQGAVFSLGETIGVEGVVFDLQEPFDAPRESHLMYFANGLSIGEADVTLTSSNNAVSDSTDWIPGSAGEYYLQVFSSRRGRWAISEAIRVCVIDFSIDSPELFDFGDYWGTLGYQGSCEIPERSPDAIPGTLTFSATASPDPLHYWPGWWDPIGTEYVHEWRGSLPDGCSEYDPVITFLATSSDPNDDVVFVKVDLLFDLVDMTTRRDYIRSQTLILTPERGSDFSSKIFTGETSPVYSKYYPTEINQTFEVRWTAYALDRSGDTIASDGPNTISIEPCYSAGMVPLSAPLPTEEPALIHPAAMSCDGIQGVSIRDDGTMRTSVKVPGVLGKYDATLNNSPITCLFYEAYPDTLLCDSPKPPSNTLATLIIFDDQGEEFCNQTFTVPGSSAGQSDKGNDEGCNLSVDICSAQGLSFDTINCQCVEIQ